MSQHFRLLANANAREFVSIFLAAFLSIPHGIPLLSPSPCLLLDLVLSCIYARDLRLALA